MSCISPVKFAHVVYRTRRFDEMLRWYETVFGATVQYQNPGLAFLTYDDEHHRFAFANMSLFQPDGTETERQGAIGADHDQVDVARDELIALCSIVHAANHDSASIATPIPTMIRKPQNKGPTGG